MVVNKYPESPQGGDIEEVDFKCYCSIMIKKLFILSAIILACAGCQTTMLDTKTAEYYQIPFDRLFPLPHWSSSVDSFKFFAEYKGPETETLDYLNEIYGDDEYGKLILGPSVYEPVYRFVPKEYFESDELRAVLKRKVVKKVDFRSLPLKDAVAWLVKEVQVSFLIRMNPDEIKACKSIDLKCEDIIALDLLERICKVTGCDYSIETRAVIVFLRSSETAREVVYEYNSVVDDYLFPKDAKSEDYEEIWEFEDDELPVAPDGSIWYRYGLLLKAKAKHIRLLDSFFDVKHILSIPEKNTGRYDFQLRLSDIVIKHMEFEDAKVSDVLKYLVSQSKELDPEKKGVDIQLKLGEKVSQDDLRITMLVDEIPLEDAIRYVCRGANLRYKACGDNVVVADESVPLFPIETRFIPIISSASDIPLENQEKLKDYFRARGISFPDGSGVSYVNNILCVRLPEKSCEQISEMMRELDDGYRTKFIFEKNAPVAAKIANLKAGDFVEVKGEMQIKEAKFNGYPFPQPCFLIKDIEAIKNPVLPKLRKYEPATDSP